MATEVKASQQWEIWSFGNCPCFTAFPELCIEWCKENNLLSASVSKTCVKTQSVGKDKVPHREMDLFRDAQAKTAMDSLQSARTHINFLTVNFPWKNISPSYMWPESLQLPTRQGLTCISQLTIRLNFVEPNKRAHGRALKRHDGEWNEVCLVREHPRISTKVIYLEVSLSILPISTKRDKSQNPTKCTVRDPEYRKGRKYTLCTVFRPNL